MRPMKRPASRCLDARARQPGATARRTWLLGLATLAVCALAAPAQAQQGAETDPTPPSEPLQAVERLAEPEPELEPIPTPQIGRRIEETFRELQDVAPRLRRQREIKVIRDALPRFTREVDLMRALPALERLHGLSPRALLDLEQEWERIKTRLSTWQSELEARVTSLAEERHHVGRAKRIWRLSLEAERPEPLPPSQLQRIQRLQGEIRRVNRRLERRIDEVLELQGQLSDEGLRIAAMLARIQSARQQARDERVQRDHRALWEGGAWLPGARPEAIPTQVAEEHAATLSTFLRRERVALAFQGACFLAFALPLFWLRRRYGEPAPREHVAPLRALRARPLASASLMTLVATPVFHAYEPSVVRALVLLLFVPAIVRLAPYLLPAPRRPQLGLIALAAVSTVVAVGYAPPVLRRALLLLLPFGGIALAFLLHRGVAKSPRLSGARRLTAWILRLAALPLLFASWYGAAGYVERAAVWIDGTFTLIETIVVAMMAVDLASGMMRMAARHRWARALFTFRKRRLAATRTLARLFRWIGLGGVLYAALVGFDVLDPLLEGSRLVLRKSYAFGSIELSVGEVIAFVAVIAGTFVVVRLVHFLLSQEVLPRFDLGQGTEAAISLTVSYLLVALGVVLAFGNAGVNPEQLALLGGALGVGIGFGLQNVVSNFVSGLILVAERPIKVGDVIEMEDLVGTVQRIGIRSSTVRSLTGAEVIVPNADLISGNLVNWTLSDARRRIDVKVGTGYDHDPAEVKQILEGAVRGQRGVLHDPKPEVLCTGFGDSSVDFEVRVWTSSYSEGVRVYSALAQRIYAVLAEEGIEIPFPQRDLHVKSIEAALPQSSGSGDSVTADESA